MQIVCEKFLEIQKKRLIDGIELEDEYKPRHICCKQTYSELVDDATLHHATSDDEFHLNNWWGGLPDGEELEKQNKNDPGKRDQMKAILLNWQIEYDRNVANDALIRC